ncbi:MAG: AsmA family protein [Candidatus Omnitrophota bacterium]
MKKFIKFILITGLILFIIIVVGIVIFLKTFDFNNLKPYIISASHNTLGRSLDFKDIGLKFSFKNGIQLSLTDLAMGEHQDFGDKDFFTAKEVNLGVSIKDFILKRQIRVLNIEADSPEINIIRLKDGRINVQSFAETEKSQDSPGKISPAAIPAIMISKINIKGARIKYIDYLIEPLLSVDLRQIKLGVTDLSLTEPFSIIASAALLSDVPNVFFEGRGEVDLANLSFLIKDAKVNADINSFSMDELRQSIPQLKQAPLFNINSGKLVSVIKLIEVGQNGLSVKLDADLKDGKIILPQVGPGISLELQRLGASIKDFSLTDEFSFNIEAAYLNQNPNIKAQGKALINIDSQTCEVKDLAVSSDLSSLSMSQLASSVVALKNVPLPQEIKGVLKVNADKLIVGSSGISQLKAQVSLNNGLVRMKELAVPLDAIVAKCDIDESAITLDSASFSLGKGKVQLSGNVVDYLGNQQFDFKAKADGIDIYECIDQKAYPIKAQGLVFGDFQINGRGFNPDTLILNLGGNSTIEIKEGKLTDINILKMVLDKLAFIPNLPQVLEANLPERFKEKLKNKDTVVTALKITTAINNGTILIQPIDMEADGFLFRGNGSVGLDQSYGFEGSFIIPSDLAAKIIETVPQMEILLDSTKQIRFPLKIIGKGTSISFYPDVASIGTTVIKNKAQEELGKVLDKVFKKSKEQDAQDGSLPQQPQDKTEPTESDSSGTPEETKSSTEQLIKSITNIIFGE